MVRHAADALPTRLFNTAADRVLFRQPSGRSGAFDAAACDIPRWLFSGRPRPCPAHLRGAHGGMRLTASA